MTLVEKEVKAVYIGSTKVRPVTSSTYLLHMPLEDSLTDISSYSRTATVQTGSITYSTIGGVKAAYNNSARVTIPMTNFTSQKYTISLWCYSPSGSSDFKVLASAKTSASSYTEVFFVTSSGYSHHWANYYTRDYFSNVSMTNGVWNLYTLSRDGNSATLYINGSSILTESVTNQNYTYTYLDLFSRSDYGQYWPGYMSELIIDSEARSTSDVSTYYNANKSKYGR